jgi:predicted methyltransferase
MEQGMTLRSSALAIFGLVLAACASSPPPPPAAQPAPPPPAPVVVAPSPAAEPPAAPVLTAEQQKKAEEQKQLETDYAKLESDRQMEVSRLTPELRKSAQALVEKSYPSIRQAIGAAMASSHRKPASHERDAERHPQQMLELFGLKANQTVLEFAPGEGWYTELLAPVLAKRGKLYLTQTAPDGPKQNRATLYGLRTKYFLEKLPEVYGKVEPVMIDVAQPPKLALPDGALDAVLVFRGAHGIHNGKKLSAWLAEFHRTLKAGGTLGVEQHRAAPGQNPDETSKQGYLPEAFLIEQIEAAGFKLTAKSEMNANPKDTKDHPDGVWSLPPTLRGGEKDRDKYLAIGESDRMTLKFTKVAPVTPSPKSR